MILDVMRQRRSIRQFRPEMPPEELLVQLVEAAGLAPSAANKQPWRFLVVRERRLIEAMALATGTVVRQIEDSVDEYCRDLFRDYSRYFLVFRNAPAVIVPLFRPVTGLSAMLNESSPAALQSQIRQAEYHAALVSVSAAIQNLLLAAEALGLGTCCTTAPVLAATRLAGLLEVPAGWEIAALVAAGYPAEHPSGPGRKPVSTILQWRGNSP